MAGHDLKPSFDPHYTLQSYLILGYPFMRCIHVTSFQSIIKKEHPEESDSKVQQKENIMMPHRN